MVAQALGSAPSVMILDSWRAGSLEVHRRGTGPRVGYLHGMVPPTKDLDFIEALASRGSEVVAPCLPGFAMTATSRDLRTMHDWVAAMSEIIDVVGITGQTVVASSVGAMLALELAAIRPEAFSHLVLIGPLGLWRDDLPVTDPFATTLREQRNLLTNDPSLTADFYEGDDANDLVAATIQRYTARTATASLVWPIPDFGLSQRIHRVVSPVTLVWGADDRIVSPAYAEYFRERLADLRAVHIVENAGHLAELDAPDKVANIVVEVIDAR